MPAMIGLDVGASSVRAIEVTRSRHGELSIRKFGQFALPLGAVRAGVAHDPGAVTSALKSLWRQAGFGSRQVAIAVTSPQVAVREVDLPTLPGKEMRQALPYLARDIIPIPTDRAQLDFVPTAAPSERGTQHGLLVGLPSKGVTDMVAAVEKSGLTVMRVDLAAFALDRALGSRLSGARGGSPATTAIIDLGASSTTVVIERAGVPLLVRTVPRGGDEITDALSDRLGISRPEAEERKRRTGAAGDDTVAEVVRSSLRPMLSEVRSSFAYFSSSQPATPIDRIVITGGGARLIGIDTIISRQEDRPTTVGNPLAVVANIPNDNQIEIFRAGSANVVGLVLGGQNSDRNTTAHDARRGADMEPRADSGKPVAAADRRRAGGAADPKAGRGRRDPRDRGGRGGLGRGRAR